jgi:rare lipoprotein A (peptidoglycan hydrolase)
MVLAMGPALPQAQAAAAGKAHYVIGKPYQFDGVWYQPEVDDSYDKTGLANVYPAGRSGLGTTSGEAYDENAIAGAHKTLPLPCFVRVTNLANGKSIILRLNDRGPFVDDRIVELTPAAARALDIAGLAQVRVQIMAKESQALAAALGAGKDMGPQPAVSVTPVPTPVVKVSNLPLLNGTAMQPMKPVAAPGAPPPMPVVSAPAVQTPAPAAATIPLAIPLPPAASTITPAPTVAAPAAAAPTPTKPAAITPATTTPPASTPITPPKPSPAAATIAAPPAAAPAITIPAAATPVAPKAVPAVSVSITNAAAPATATPTAAPAIPVQLTSVPTAPADAGKVKPLPVDLPAQFFIQTGAFKSAAQADQLREKLAQLAPAKIVPTRLGADPFNAVLLGPIPSMGDAQRLLKQITGMGYADAVLIIE